MTQYRAKAEITIDVTADGLDDAWERAEFTVGLFKELFMDIGEAKVTEVDEIDNMEWSYDEPPDGPYPGVDY